MNKFLTLALVALPLFAACSKPADPPAPAAPPPLPAPSVSIKVPAGTYAVDPYHSSLSFSVMHMGLAPYVARFTKFEAELALDPANVSASIIKVSIDPLSVRTDYSGDYKATHKGSPFASFDERIGKEAQFFNADMFPKISFTSTSAKVSGQDRLEVTGDLSFLGQTHPVTLDVAVTGSMAEHAWTKHGAIGITANGSFARSAFGMEPKPGILEDTVRIEFSGEFHQKVVEPAR